MHACPHLLLRPSPNSRRVCLFSLPSSSSFYICQLTQDSSDCDISTAMSTGEVGVAVGVTGEVAGEHEGVLGLLLILSLILWCFLASNLNRLHYTCIAIRYIQFHILYVTKIELTCKSIKFSKIYQYYIYFPP